MHGKATPVDDLVLRAQHGDVAAFDGLVRAHREAIGRLVQRFVGPRGDVEDVVQEVLIQLHRALPSFRGGMEDELPSYEAVTVRSPPPTSRW